MRDQPMTALTPNPHSPYADADPAYRHLLPALFGIAPKAGVLAVAACGGMAVAPETLGDATDALVASRLSDLPEGLCPTCVAVANGQQNEPRPASQDCSLCDGTSSHGSLCALCRQDLHDEWWATGEEARP